MIICVILDEFFFFIVFKCLFDVFLIFFYLREINSDKVLVN